MIFLFRRIVSDASHPHCVHNAERSREPSSKSEKLLPLVTHNSGRSFEGEKTSGYKTSQKASDKDLNLKQTLQLRTIGKQCQSPKGNNFLSKEGFGQNRMGRSKDFWSCVEVASSKVQKTKNVLWVRMDKCLTIFFLNRRDLPDFIAYWVLVQNMSWWRLGSPPVLSPCSVQSHLFYPDGL